MNKKSPDHVDAHVGERIRERRIALGMAQQALANELGLTFQQVQKYEKGMNRIGAGRLHAIAKTLGVDAGYFFEDLDDGRPARRPEPEGIFDTREGMRLARAFGAIGSAEARHKLVEIAELLAAETQGKKRRGGRKGPQR